MPLLPGYAGPWSRLSLRPVHRAGQLGYVAAVGRLEGTGR